MQEREDNRTERFPGNFLWGCGGSPTQVEGRTVNEWAGVIARDGRHADEGPGQWERFEEDLPFLEALHVNAYRIGLDWARLQHGPGEPLDAQALDRYRAMLGGLRGRGIEPVVTLFHFACPRWLAQRGGWTGRSSPAHFEDFVARCARALPGVRIWITINEPAVYVLMAYLLGVFPPFRRGRVDLALRALRSLRTAHTLAYRCLHEIRPGCRVGIAKHVKALGPFRPWHPLDRLGGWLANRLFDEFSLGPFLRYRGEPVSDFLGINYYGRLRMRGFRGLSPLAGFPAESLARDGIHCDDMWEQDPEFLADCIARIGERSGLPLIITENGVATRDEDLRVHYLERHLRSCELARARGVDLRGYFYWSFLDNFEWSEGYDKRFGLVGVDFDDPAKPRTMRPAGRLFARAAKEPRLAPGGNAPGD